MHVKLQLGVLFPITLAKINLGKIQDIFDNDF